MRGIERHQPLQPVQEDAPAAVGRAGVALLARIGRGGARIGRGVLFDTFLELAAALFRLHERDGGEARQDQQQAGGRQLIGYAARHLHASSIVAAHARSTPA